MTRWICPSCGAVYESTTNVPAMPAVLQNCRTIGCDGKPTVPSLSVSSRPPGNTA